MNGRIFWIAAVWLVFTASLRGAEVSAAGLPMPLPQNMGYAYTRTGVSAGLFKIEDQVAIFPGSRYGFVKGLRVRLDDADVLRGEAVSREGQVYVPAAFAAYLALKEVKPAAPAPSYLKDRWVYTVARPAFTLPEGVRTLTIGGKPYVNFGDVGKALGLHVYEDPTGLVCIGPRPSFDYTSHELTLRDSTLSAFDMPEKFADPAMAVKYLPNRGALNPALPRPVTPPPPGPITGNDLNGFNAKLLGSPPPAPGIYPRLFFSPEDITAFRERLKQDPAAQAQLAKIGEPFKATWWNPSTADGKILDRLAKGGEVQLDSSQRSKVLNQLVTIALYSLFAADDTHGTQAAAAIANFYKSVEPEIDRKLAASESEFGGNSTLTGFGPVQWEENNDLIEMAPFALDGAGKWMTPEQKDLLRGVVVKTTYGRRVLSRDNPRPVQNASTRGLGHLVAVASIEGLEGYDAEAYASGSELARDILDNRATAGDDDLDVQLLTMIMLARRGNNLWGHPYWRTLIAEKRNLHPFTSDLFRSFYPGLANSIPQPDGSILNHSGLLIWLYYTTTAKTN